MKLVLLATIDSLSPIYGGGALRVLKVAEKFKERGYQVIFAAPSDKKRLNNVRAYSIPAPTKKSALLSTMIFNIRLCLKIISILGKIDIFFVHNTTAAIAIFFMTRIFRRRFIMDVTDLHTEYLLCRKRNFMEKFLTPFLIFGEYLIIKSADHIIAVSYAMKKHLVSHRCPEEKISVVYDGAEVIRFPQKKEKGANFGIIHFGRMDLQHGVVTFVKAIPFILQEFPATKFYFVGEGTEFGRVKQLIKNLHINSSCVITGYKPYQEATKYLQKVSIGVISRPGILANHLVVTVKLFEYWAATLAVVSSHLKSIGEIAKDRYDILFFQPGNFKDLAEKILLLLQKPDLLKRLQQNGQETVKKFDWNFLASQIVEVSVKNG